MLHILTFYTISNDAAVAQMALNQRCMSTSCRCTTWRACGCETCVRDWTLTVSYAARCGRASSTAWFTTWTWCKTDTSTNSSCVPSTSLLRYAACSCAHQRSMRLYSVSEEVGVIEHSLHDKLLACAILCAPPKFLHWCHGCCYAPDQQIRCVIKLTRLTVELRGRASDSTKRTRVRILCCGVKTLGKFFPLHYSSYINEYLAIDSGGYVYEQPSRINCSIWLDASQSSWDGVWLNRSAREVNRKSALSSPF